MGPPEPSQPRRPADCGWGVPWPQVLRPDTRTLRAPQRALPQCPDKPSVLDQAGNERAQRGRNLGNVYQRADQQAASN
jgi:hypothetical protein